MDPATLTRSLARKYLAHYDTVLPKVYATKKLNSKISLQQALDDDRWRYVQLPSSLSIDYTQAPELKDHNAQNSAKNSNSNAPEPGLYKPDLARLVRWKTTHGHSRPFLAGMVAKNSEQDIEEYTAAARSILLAGLTALSASNTDNTDNKKANIENLNLETFKRTVKSSLSCVTKLHGVGPATASLVLSIFAPGLVPFFEDELYIWLTNSKAGAKSTANSVAQSKGKEKTAEVKLKYDLKEYEFLLDHAWGVMRRTGLDARELEKVAYVLEHLDVLHDEDIAVNAPRESESNSDSEVEPRETEKRDSKTGGSGRADKTAKTTTTSSQRQNQSRKRKTAPSNDQKQDDNEKPRRSRRLHDSVMKNEKRGG